MIGSVDTVRNQISDTIKTVNDVDLKNKSAGFLDKLKKTQRKHLKKLVLEFDFDTNLVLVSSTKLDSFGQPLI